MTSATNNLIAIVGLAVIAASCRTAGVDPAPQAAQRPASGAEIVQPGAPGQASRVIAAETSARSGALPHTVADTKFMQGMIGHHAQAIEMTALLYTRSNSDDMKLLAKRIDVSQEDEINMMQTWLKSRGLALPDPHAHHLHDEALMPGMLTKEEMSRLAAAKGVEFDRLFLEGMIKHHMGALTMVRDLFASPGAGQEADIFAFASDVDADQRMEIDRMGSMLAMMK